MEFGNILGTDGDDEIPEKLQHIMDRDVETLTFPDQVYALGGGGTRMVQEIFGQSWVAVEAMRGRTNDLTLNFVDTATEDLDDLGTEMAELKRNLGQLNNLFRRRASRGTNVGTIDVQHEVITEEVSIASRADLIGDDIIQNVKRQTDADHWWIRQPHLEPRDNRGTLFNVSAGAIKRRGVGKAMHYKGLAEHREYRDLLRTQGEDERIALFAGLGGGTGSGFCIDVAREIKKRNENAEIVLFATLPGPNETEEALANTYAALSELEYLYLSSTEDDSEGTPFDNIILFPLYPTGHESDTTRGEQIDRFDRAMAYSVVGYYNNADHDFAVRRTTPYAPFTIAVPQVLHYKRDEVKAAKDEAADVLDRKREALNCERRILDAVDAFLDDQYPTVTPVDPTSLSENAEKFLLDRLRHFDRLVTFDLFDELDYDLDERRRALNRIYGNQFDPETTDIVEVVKERGFDQIFTRDLETFLASHNYTDSHIDEYSELTEDFLKDVVSTELVRLKKIYSTTRNVAAIHNHDDSDLTARLLEAILLPTLTQQETGDRFANVNEKLASIDGDVTDIEAEIEQLENQVEHERADHATTVNDRYQELYVTVQDDLRAYQKLRDVDVTQELTELENALSEYANDVASADDPHSVGGERVKTAVRDLDTALSGVDRVEVDALEDSVNQGLELLREARDAWDELEDKASGGGFISDFLGGGTGDIDTTRYSRVRSDIENDNGIFAVTSTPTNAEYITNTDFRATLDFDFHEAITGRVEDARRKTRETILSEYSDLLAGFESAGNHGGTTAPTATGTAPPTAPNGGDGGATMTNPVSGEELQETLADAPTATFEERFEETVKESIRAMLDTDIPELEADLEECRREREQFVTWQERLQTVKDLYATFGEDVRRYTRIYEAVADEFHQDSVFLETSNTSRQSLDQPFIHEISPNNISRAIRRPALAKTDILDPNKTQEREEVKDLLGRMVSNRAVRSKYNGLEKSAIGGDGDGHLSSTTINLAMVSEAIDKEGTNQRRLARTDFSKVQESLETNFQNSLDNTENWMVQNGDPWEIGFSVYFQGISVLDNLRDMTSHDGYAATYEMLAGNTSDHELIIRHAYGLERGVFTRRAQFVDIQNDPTLFTSGADDEIADALLEHYEVIDINESDADVDDGDVTPADEAHPQHD